MDPQAALINCEKEIENQRYRDALQLLLGYYHWRVQGGAQPYNGDLRAHNLAVKLQDGFDECF